LACTRDYPDESYHKKLTFIDEHNNFIDETKIIEINALNQSKALN